MEIKITERDPKFFELAMDEFRNQVENAKQNQDDRDVILEFDLDNKLGSIPEVVATSYVDYNDELKSTRFTSYSKEVLDELGINY